MAAQVPQAPQIQYQPPQDQKSQNKNFSPATSLFSVFFIAVILFTGAYFYLKYLQDQNIEKSKTIENTEENFEQEQNLLQEAIKNDQTRKLNVTTIQKGLTQYFEKNAKYPKNLEELTPDYLQVIPLDPVTKEPYDYVPNVDFSSFTLSAKLSDGSSYEVSSD